MSIGRQRFCNYTNMLTLNFFYSIPIEQDADLIASSIFKNLCSCSTTTTTTPRSMIMIIITNTAFISFHFISTWLWDSQFSIWDVTGLLTQRSLATIRNRPESSLKGCSIQSQEILNLLDSESLTGLTCPVLQVWSGKLGLCLTQLIPGHYNILN